MNLTQSQWLTLAAITATVYMVNVLLAARKNDVKSPAGKLADMRFPLIIVGIVIALVARSPIGDLIAIQVQKVIQIIAEKTAQVTDGLEGQTESEPTVIQTAPATAVAPAPVALVNKNQVPVKANYVFEAGKVPVCTDQSTDRLHYWSPVGTQEYYEFGDGAVPDSKHQQFNCWYSNLSKADPSAAVVVKLK